MIDSLISWRFLNNNSSLGWFMARATMSALKQQVDTDGYMRWSTLQGQKVIRQNLLFEIPVYIDEGMDAIGANKFPILLGSFKDYLTLQSSGMTIREAAFTGTPTRTWYTRLHTGGDIRKPREGGFKLLKCST
jgi:HK97 family phage major capsid protein